MTFPAAFRAILTATAALSITSCAGYRLGAEYFYPASSIKLCAAVAALQTLEGRSVLFVQSLPAVWFLLDRQLAGRNDGFPFWVQLTLLISIVEFSYALSLLQVVDYSSLRIVAIVALAVAMAYAFLLALAMLAPQGQLLASLELVDAARSSRISLVCLAIIAVHGVLAWVSGRGGARWRLESQNARVGS